MTPSQQYGILYLIPVSLGQTVPWACFLPTQTQTIAAGLHYFVVENARAARAHLKQIDYPAPLRETSIRELPEKPSPNDLNDLLQPALNGHAIGLMSDAGSPAVADPGAFLVAHAHRLGIQVIPLVGPSSILLGLMASGLNGQSFVFHGYLPVAETERNKHLQLLEAESRRLHRTQIFIETPYRNDKLLEALLTCCQPTTRLCVACDLTTPTEYIRTHTIIKWKQADRPSLAKRPALFLLLAD